MEDWRFLVFSESSHKWVRQWKGREALWAVQGKTQEESESKEDSKAVLKLEPNLRSYEIFTELKFELK